MLPLSSNWPTTKTKPEHSCNSATAYGVEALVTSPAKTQRNPRFL